MSEDWACCRAMQSKPRCTKCARDHDCGPCAADVKLKCFNCGNIALLIKGVKCNKERKKFKNIKCYTKYHMLEQLSKSCLVLQLEPHALSSNVISTADFPPPPQGPNSNPTDCSHECAINYDTLIVSRLNFVAFIGKVVNATLQQSKKTARLRTIVEAANEYLSMKDLTLGIFHELLLVAWWPGGQSVINIIVVFLCFALECQ